MALKSTSKKSTKPAAATAKSTATRNVTAVKASRLAAQPVSGSTVKPKSKRESTVTPKTAPAVAAVTTRAGQPGATAQAPTEESQANQQVSFTYFAPQAGSVLLAGDFTRWEAAPVRLHREGAGVWSTTLALPPGRYEYRLLVDGRWQNDPECREFQPNEFGSTNCVRLVAA